MSEEVMEVIAEQEIFGKTFHVYGDWLEPRFLAKEVAELIDYAKTGKGYRDVSRMIGSVDEDEKATKNVRTHGGVQNCWFLTEQGLYEILFQSRKPLAKQFKKYVKTVLKEIRLKGSYNRETTSEDYKEALTQLAEIITDLKHRLEDANNYIKELKNNSNVVSVDTSILLNRFSCKDGVIFANENVDASVFAYLIGEPYYKFTNSKVYEWMRNHDYLMSKAMYGDKNHNLPYDEYFEEGLFKVSEYKVIRGHSVHDATKLLITPKGQLYFGKLIRDEFIHTNKPFLLESR